MQSVSSRVWTRVAVSIPYDDNHFMAIQNGGKSESDQILNRNLSSNFCWLLSAKYMKFTEEFWVCTEKHVLIKKVFTNVQNIGLLPRRAFCR